MPDPNAPIPMSDPQPDDEGVESALPEDEITDHVDDADAGIDDGDPSLDEEI